MKKAYEKEYMDVGEEEKNMVEEDEENNVNKCVWMKKLVWMKEMNVDEKYEGEWKIRMWKDLWMGMKMMSMLTLYKKVRQENYVWGDLSSINLGSSN